MTDWSFDVLDSFMAIYVLVAVDVLPGIYLDDNRSRHVALPEFVAHFLQDDHSSSPHRPDLCYFTGVVTLRRHYGHAASLFHSL